MTTRHTITHADEIYAGNAFKAGYSPDGRRGIKMTHLYLHRFLSTAGAAPIAKDNDGILPAAFLMSKWSASNGCNNISSCTGALASAGTTLINLDVPRNITCVSTGNEAAKILKIHGYDQYGEPMAEAIVCGAANTEVSGYRAFKSISRMYTTAAFTATAIKIGVGNRLGLPFHLQTSDKIAVVNKDGRALASAAATAAYVIHIGASSATTMTSSGKQPDARGDILFSAPWAPDGTIKFSALMEVDRTTERAAFGPPQVSSCSNG